MKHFTQSFYGYFNHYVILPKKNCPGPKWNIASKKIHGESHLLSDPAAQC